MSRKHPLDPLWKHEEHAVCTQIAAIACCCNGGGPGTGGVECWQRERLAHVEPITPSSGVSLQQSHYVDMISHDNS